MKRFLQTLILVFSLILLNQNSFAVIAYPYPVEIIQPDGSKLTVILKGDEHVKWAQTDDGYSIMRNGKGVFEYAIIDSKNDMVPSGIKAKNQKERDDSDKTFLNKVKKGLVYSKSQVGMMKSISEMYQKDSQKSFPTTGTRKLICILMGFKDKAFTKTQTDFNNLFNQVGYNTDGATGSIKDYYAENSYGLLDLTVTVAGPFTSANNMSYYGGNNTSGNDQNPKALITEAVNLANASVNYADFDNDIDGKVDGVYVIYAGYGEEAGGGPAGADAIWAHAWGITPVVLDGKTISSYSCSAELRGGSGSGLTRIGVICHEFGHVMGASDYYDTDYADNGSYTGTGNWDLMAGGSWNNNGATPAHHNAYTKVYDYQWASATTLSAGSTITLNNAEQNTNSFYRINTATTNEFYLIENRQKHKFDSYLPGSGMIIYHVDKDFMDNAGNSINAGEHQGMYPVCADAAGNPPTTYGAINSSGLPFPGSSDITSFTDETTPSAKSWAGANTYRPITDITKNVANKTVTFSFMGGIACTTPTVQATSFSTTSVTSSSMTVNWTRGDGTNILVVAKEGSSFDNEPISGVSYTANSVFKSGDQIGTSIYAIYKGTGTSVDLTGLVPGMTYYFSVYEYNSSSNCYLTPGLNGNTATPCSLVSTFPFSEGFEAGVLSSCWTEILDANNLHWDFRNGNGANLPNYPPVSANTGTKNLCLMNNEATPMVTKLVLPAFDISALSNPTLQFSHIQALAGPDQDELRVYYKTSAGGSWVALRSYTRNITSWTKESILLPNPSSDYYIAFEGTAKWGSGVCIDDILVAAGAPTAQATAFTFGDITNYSMTIGWTRGNGNEVIVVAKEGSVTSTAAPSDGVSYTANAYFSSGGLVATGNRVVYKGVGTSVAVSGLNPGATYYYSIYEYANPSICYLTPALTGNVTTTSTGIDDLESANSSYLKQNYPNPFDQSTTIDFKLVKPSKVNLTVYNTLGQVVEVIVDEYLSVGTYSKTWSPKGIAAGFYFYQLKAEGIKETKRLIKK